MGTVSEPPMSCLLINLSCAGSNTERDYLEWKFGHRTGLRGGRSSSKFAPYSSLTSKSTYKWDTKLNFFWRYSLDFRVKGPHEEGKAEKESKPSFLLVQCKNASWYGQSCFFNLCEKPCRRISQHLGILVQCIPALLILISEPHYSCEHVPCAKWTA